MPNSSLPPLSAVRAFEAAARHLSFTRAGEELGMTQAAVSYQIRLLEERVGEPLFVRRPRQVALTEAGTRLAPHIWDAFDRMRLAFDDLARDSGGTLNINAVPTFAINWLGSRIGRFQIENPDLAIRMETATSLIDFADNAADVALRSGKGDWPGLRGHKLLEAVYTPMLSPKLAASIGGVKEPADLMKLPILDPGDHWWSEWSAAAGLGTEWLEGMPSNRMGVQVMEAVMATASTGVAILTPAFYERELATGALIQPFDIYGYSGEAYWLVYPEARRNVPKIRRFRDWILKEAGMA
ncbi:LysR substrate-binding domain-containing protein [Pseudohoeflea suaedae]|nr:LysR substrate-binding domain-containing protein [Pseudohoeflea suaedae]